MCNLSSYIYPSWSNALHVYLSTFYGWSTGLSWTSSSTSSVWIRDHRFHAFTAVCCSVCASSVLSTSTCVCQACSVFELAFSSWRADLISLMSLKQQMTQCELEMFQGYTEPEGSKKVDRKRTHGFQVLHFRSEPLLHLHKLLQVTQPSAYVFIPA